jgi:hypothetical protein
MRTFAIFTVCLFAALRGVPADAKPQILYRTFGPEPGYEAANGSAIGGPKSKIKEFASGFVFTPTATANLDAVEVAVGLVGGTNAFDLTLRLADGPGGGPGTILETFHVVGKMEAFGKKNPVIRVECNSERLLKAGTKYWLVATAEGDTQAAWNLCGRAITGTYFSVQGGGRVLLPNQAVGAFAILGTPVP